MGQFVVLSDIGPVAVAVFLAAAVLVFGAMQWPRLRPLDSLLLATAITAIVAAIGLGPSGCHFVDGDDLIALAACEARFPIEIASGVAVAVVALLIVAVRVRQGHDVAGSTGERF